MTRYVLYFNNRYGCRTLCKIEDELTNDNNTNQDNNSSNNNAN